jgi:hypothetical protein
MHKAASRQRRIKKTVMRRGEFSGFAKPCWLYLIA